MSEDQDMPSLVTGLPGEVNHSPTKPVLPEWLEMVGVVEMPAIGLFRAEDEFLSIVMSSRKWIDGIGEVQPNLIFFQEFLDDGGIEESATPPVSLRLLRLLETATSETIVTELEGEASVAVTIGQIVQLLRQGEFRVGDCLLFFARGRSGVLRPITCTTDARWGGFVNRVIIARQMDGDYRWDRNWQVVFR